MKELVDQDSVGIGGKVAGREVEHLPPSSAEVKERLELYFTPPIRLQSVVRARLSLPLPTLLLLCTAGSFF